MSVTAASGLAPNLYTDPKVFARERERIFRGGWCAIARSDALPGPNTYLAADLFGDPIVVTRDESGSVAAFSNVCLHRACLIADGHGTARGGALSCPYHRWTYALDGRLRGAPHMEQAIGFDKRSQRLPPLAAEEWQGWVFVNTDADAAPLAPALEPLTRALRPFGLERMKEFAALEFPSPWNWKVLIDNFMESYHVFAAHPQTLEPVYPAAATYVEPLGDGPFVVLENPSIVPTIGALWVACVFPSMLFALTRGERPLVAWYDMRIRRHDYFDLTIRLLGHEDWLADSHATEQSAAIARAIHMEDIRMCEGVWRGLQSSYARAGRLSHLEESTWRFHEWWRSKIGS